jgi:hypothetical protein
MGAAAQAVQERLHQVALLDLRHRELEMQVCCCWFL